jgi:hypothetical protein
VRRSSAHSGKSRFGALPWALTAVLVSALGLASLTGVLSGSRTVEKSSARSGQNAWKDTATREDVEKYMGLRVPADADDVRWAYRNGFQDDAAALTFTGPSERMETFVDEIDGEHLPGLAMHGGDQTEFFTRLNVQSPEGLTGAKARGIRYTDASTGADDLNVWTASGPPGRTRVWIIAFDL